MTIGFSQKETHHMCKTTVDAFYNGVADGIRRNTDLDYAFTRTETGCFLKPTFRNMSYINSFVPEIDVVVSKENGQTALHMKGRPVMLVRVIMYILFAQAAVFELILLLIAATSAMDNLFPVFIPIILAVFGYLLCKVTTKVTFRSVMNAIRKEFL